MSREDIYKQILRHISDGVYFCDSQRHIVYWNKAAQDITGYTNEQVKQHCCHDHLLCHTDLNGRPLCMEACPLKQTLEDGKERTADVLLQHAQGHRVRVRIRTMAVRNEQNKIIGATQIFADVAAQKGGKEYIHELERMAYVDGLTGIPNRRIAEANLLTSVDKCRHTGTELAVLMVDIDNLKQINQEHGYEMGNRVLKTVAGHLMACARETDIMARWGNEEFILILENVAQDDLEATAHRIRGTVEKAALVYHGLRIGITVSIGGTLLHPGDTAGTFILRVEELLQRSKQDGRNRVTLAA